MLAKDTCRHSLIYTTNRVIFELQNRVMLTNGHINFIQIRNISNLIKPSNSYFTPGVYNPLLHIIGLANKKPENWGERKGWKNVRALIY